MPVRTIKYSRCRPVNRELAGFETNFDLAGRIAVLPVRTDGVTYRHYAHRAPLAFRAILSLPQPTAFTTLARGFEGHCPCCRRSFAQAKS